MKRSILIILVVVAACSAPFNPTKQNAKLAERFPLGSSARQFQEYLKAQNFVLSFGPVAYDQKRHLSGGVGVKGQFVGYQRLIGAPNGKISCYDRPYTSAFNSGQRVVCFTQNARGNLTWHQTGSYGVGL